MTHPLTDITLSGVGNCGKTTLATHVLASAVGGTVLSLESHSPGDDAELIDRDALVARLFAPPAGGLVLDVGVGDTLDAIEALRLVGRQDSSLPSRLQIVVPLLVDAKSVAGLRWLLGQMPESLRPSVRAVWNRVRRGEESAIRDGDIARAGRAVAKQGGARLCSTPLYESGLYEPTHPLVRQYGGVAAVAAIPDAEIRSAPLADMPTLLAGRDQAQSALANCQQVLAAIEQ